MGVKFYKQKEKPNRCKKCGSKDAKILCADIVDCKRKRYFVMCADCGHVLYDPKDEENDYVKDYDTVSDAVNAWNADKQ